MNVNRINEIIEKKTLKRKAIAITAKALREFQHDIGTQDCLDARQVLGNLDKKLFKQIIFLKRKVNKLYEQPRC